MVETQFQLELGENLVWWCPYGQPLARLVAVFHFITHKTKRAVPSGLPWCLLEPTAWVHQREIV